MNMMEVDNQDSPPLQEITKRESIETQDSEDSWEEKSVENCGWGWDDPQSNHCDFPSFLD